MNKNHAIIAVIPAYNEETDIGKVVRQARKYVTKVIVCDDGSTDRTGDVAEACGAIVVRHRQNMGYGAALSTLFNEARKLNPDVVVTLDADGQHDPAYIPKLVEPVLRNGADVVIGSRFLSREAMDKIPAYRKVGISIITKFTNRVAYSGITDAQSGLRAFSRKALEAIQPAEHGFGASTEVLIKANQANLRIEETPVTISYERKRSKRNPITHLFKVVFITVKLASTRRPQIFYGVPAIAALVVGLGFWVRTGLMYSTTGQIWTDITFIALGATIISLIFSVVAVTLWMLMRALREALTSEE